MTKCIDKKFKIPGHKIIALIPHRKSCFATDKITVEGLPVGYMYREQPNDNIDTGWRFFSGTESQEYVDDPDNTCIFATNTIANYDPTIIPYLDLPPGTELEKKDGSTFSVIKD